MKTNEYMYAMFMRLDTSQRWFSQRPRVFSVTAKRTKNWYETIQVKYGLFAYQLERSHSYNNLQKNASSDASEDLSKRKIPSIQNPEAAYFVLSTIRNVHRHVQFVQSPHFTDRLLSRRLWKAWVKLSFLCNKNRRKWYSKANRRIGMTITVRRGPGGGLLSDRNKVTFQKRNTRDPCWIHSSSSSVESLAGYAHA